MFLRLRCFIVAAIVFSATTGVYAEKLGDIVTVDMVDAYQASDDRQGGTQGRVDYYQFGKSDASLVLLHFDHLELEQGETIRLFDAQSHLVQALSSADNGRRFWAIAADGDELNVVYNRNHDSRGFFSVDKAIYGSYFNRVGGSGQVQIAAAICGADDKLDIQCPVVSTTQRNRARAVGRMLIVNSGGGSVCSGFLVSRLNHFLTNEHCIGSQANFASLQVRFNYQHTQCGGNTLASYTTVVGASLIKKDVSLDYALLKLNGNPAASYGFLTLAAGPLSNGASIYMPQHPYGRAKQYDSGSVYDASINLPNVRAGKAFLYSSIDTQIGSSGSPVLSTATNQVVGLNSSGGCSTTTIGNAGILSNAIYPQIKIYLGSTSSSGATGNGFVPFGALFLLLD